MPDKSTSFTQRLPRVGAQASLLGLLLLFVLSVLPVPLQAEPVVNGPAQPANRLIDATPWLSDAPVVPAQTASREAATAPNAPTHAITAPSSVNRSATAPGSNQPSPVNTSPDLARPPATVSAPNSPNATVKPPAPKAREDLSASDVRGAVKDAVRPLYEELNSSDAVQTLRGIHSELGLDKDQALSGVDTGQPNRPEGSNPPLNATPWEGQPSREAPRTAAQVERDKVLASVLMDKLIDEVTPWVIGLVVLYVLYYLTKLALAYGRHRSNRRRQGSMRGSSRSRSRSRASHSSSNPTT